MLLAAASEYAFVTKNRSALKLEGWFSVILHRQDVTLYPQVRLWFDALLNQSTSQAGIRLLDRSGPVARKSEGRVAYESNGMGDTYFELSQPLALNKKYRVNIGSSVTDVTGLSTGQSAEIAFTSRTKAYETGTTVEKLMTIFLVSGIRMPAAAR
ncbi:MAG: Ig-like domain-containing protein [Marinilabiliales bacterium]|nr:Ig-like domain-containing protein [Marinilabiliales bacterium]